MVDVVSVKFKGRGKTYYFDPNGLDVPAGAQVVVETSKGLELCECVQGVHTVTDERIVPPLRPVARLATADDLRIAELCKAREKEAFGIAEKKIAEHGLEMKLVDVECAFDGSKILFFFTADGRVDFRALVKDLAGVFRTRIELRQIGVRDEAKMLGGIGMCGRPYCCNQFLDDFQPVSTKMAKVQSLSLNPTKISGCCGRLMCCLRYEEEAYEELVKTVPKVGAFVETVAGYGNVTQVNLLRQTVKVRLDGDNESLHSYAADEVAAIPGGRPKDGSQPPHILKIKPKPKEEPEPVFDDWAAPPIFAEDTAEPAPARPAEGSGKRSGQRRHRSRGGSRNTAQPQEKAVSPASGEGKQSASSRSRRGAQGNRQGKAPAAEKSAANPQPVQRSAQKTDGAAPSGKKKAGRSSRRRWRGKPRPKSTGE